MVGLQRNSPPLPCHPQGLIYACGCYSAIFSASELAGVALRAGERGNPDRRPRLRVPVAIGRVPDGQILGEPTRERASAFHLGAVVVSESGRAALIGHAAFMQVAGVAMTTDFEHYAMVFEP